jgi:hypothetical protein
MARILEVSKVQTIVIKSGLPTEFQSAIDSKTVIAGMSYQMVLMSFGDPEQKRLDDATDGTFGETWYYLKDGRRWVLKFTNGKISKVQAY